MRLEPLLNPDCGLMASDMGSRDDLFRLIAESAAGRLAHESADRLFQVLVEREEKFPTSTPEGVAFPHAMIGEISETLLIPVLARPAVDFDHPTHPPADLVFAIFGAETKPFQHVQLLARLARVVRGPGAMERLRACVDAEAFRACLIDEDRTHG